MLKRIILIKLIVSIALMFNSATLLSATPEEAAEFKNESDALAFFNNLKNYCGKTFEGESVFPADPEDAFFGKKLTAKLAVCNESEIRVPFVVGEDTSRTWVLTLKGDRLLLKHDHRHKDGTPHEVTMYGGLSDGNGSQWQQSFPADKETAEMIPAAKTNVWMLILDKDKKTLTYYLTRHGEDRFRAVLGVE